MPMKEKAVLSVSTTVENKRKIVGSAERHELSVAKLVVMLVDAVERGEIVIDGGEIKARTVEKVVEVPVETDNFKYERKFKKIIGMMEEKGYPNGVIERMIDGMTDNVRDMGKYRKGRTEEWC